LQLVSVRGTEKRARARANTLVLFSRSRTHTHLLLELPKTSLILRMSCIGSVKVLVATLLLSSVVFFDNRSFSEGYSAGGPYSKTSFSKKKHPWIFFLTSSKNNLKMHLLIKTMDSPGYFRYQKTVCLFGLRITRPYLNFRHCKYYDNFNPL
jgi:hypothetical protein